MADQGVQKCNRHGERKCHLRCWNRLFSASQQLTDFVVGEGKVGILSLPLPTLLTLKSQGQNLTSGQGYHVVA